MHILKCTKINAELCSCAFQLYDISPHFTSFLDSSSRSLILDKVCKLVLQVVFYSIGQKSTTTAGSNDAWFLMGLFLMVNCLGPLRCPLTTYTFPPLSDSWAKGRMSLDWPRAMHMLTGQPRSDEQSKANGLWCWKSPWGTDCAGFLCWLIIFETSIALLSPSKVTQQEKEW